MRYRATERTMATRYEDSVICLVNVRVTRGWRRHAHEQARARGMNLTEYLKHLVAQDNTPT